MRERPNPQTVEGGQTYKRDTRDQKADSSHLHSQPRGRGHCKMKGTGTGESSRAVECGAAKGGDMPGSGRRLPHKDVIGLCQ